MQRCIYVIEDKQCYKINILNGPFILRQLFLYEIICVVPPLEKSLFAFLAFLFPAYHYGKKEELNITFNSTFMSDSFI